jgi:Domain of unknown function (DUF4145)
MLVECSYCAAIVDAKEMAEYEWDERFEPGGQSVPWNSKVTFAHCPVCKGPLLAYQDDADFDGAGATGWGEPVRVYPARDRELGFSVPNDITRAFTEARTCYRNKAFTASTIMCRKTLEGICSAHGARSSDKLAAQLEKLKESGVIENRLFEWAEALRTMGNEAAHGVESVISAADARDTLEFTEALIEYVFTYRDKFESFKKRRAKATASPQKQKPDESF